MVTKILAISKYRGRRPRILPTPEIFANARDFRRRPRFSPPPEIFADARFRRWNRRRRIGATRKKFGEKKFSGRRPENFFETATDINTSVGGSGGAKPPQVNFSV